MPIGVPIGVKVTVTSNISYLMNYLSDGSIFNDVRVETYVPVMISTAGDHPFPNLFLCSSNFADEMFLGILVMLVPPFHFIYDVGLIPKWSLLCPVIYLLR